jgi:hypothetical protein
VWPSNVFVYLGIFFRQDEPDWLDRAGLEVAALAKVWPSGGGLFVWYADRIQSGAESRALQRAVGFWVIFGFSFGWFSGFGRCEGSGRDAQSYL